ncbi:MAG: HAMP domain-containing sensor histidine kinase [Actinomycetota bacterium]|nr:HAMP domain-containing sensor histidine kinase [Actinomycetota bacterium]
MKIQDKLTNYIAIVLFLIILMASLIFTSLFVFNDRNSKLIDLTVQNTNFAEGLLTKYPSVDDALRDPGFFIIVKGYEGISGARITLIDKNFNIILNPYDLTVVDAEKIITSNSILRGFSYIGNSNNLEKIVNFNLTNKKYYVSVYKCRVGSQDLYSAFFKEKNNLDIPPMRYLFALSLLSLTALLVSYFTGFLLSKNISGNLILLSKHVKKISSGDYEEEISIKTRDEIEDLANNINIMKNKIKESQSSLKEYTSMISHEIKNMLTVIQGYSEGIKSGIYRNNKEIGYALEKIINKSKDLENLTNSLLLLSKVENKIIEIEKDEIYPVIIINEMIEIYGNQLAISKLRMIKKIATKEDFKLKSDKYLLQTILSNLINNAIKYSLPDSNIEISLSSEIRGGVEYLVFSVSNEGLEISKEDKEKIFKMFCRGDKAEFYNIEGYGLGLAISHKIAHYLNARLDFRSEGKLNTFILRIQVKGARNKSG